MRPSIKLGQTQIFPSPEGDAKASLDTLSSIVRAIASGEVRRHLQAQADATEVCGDPKPDTLSAVLPPVSYSGCCAPHTALAAHAAVLQRFSDRRSGTDVLPNQAVVIPLCVVQPSSSPCTSAQGLHFSPGGRHRKIAQQQQCRLHAQVREPRQQAEQAAQIEALQKEAAALRAVLASSGIPLPPQPMQIGAEPAVRCIFFLERAMPLGQHV